MSDDPAQRDEPAWKLGPVVEELCSANQALLAGRRRLFGRHLLPSQPMLGEIVADLRAALFPGHFGSSTLSDESIRYFVGQTLDDALFALEEQVHRGLLFNCVHGVDGECELCQAKATEVMVRFVARLPAIRQLLAGDLEAAYEGDPAATSLDEAIFCYPGFMAITHHRIAHELFRFGVPLIPRIIAELAHGSTGVDIHPGAEIGGRFFIDHGTGVVIGETSKIGQRVRLYQGVTLGAKRFDLDDQGRPVKGVPRHPIVEDDVVIYAGATILGRITIGRGSSIGGNVWLTRSVPAGSRVTQAQAREEIFDSGSGI